MLLTQLLELLGDAEPKFVAGYSTPGDMGVEIECVIFTDRFVLIAVAAADDEPAVEVRSRRRVRGVAVLGAPNLVLPYDATVADRTPWSIRVDLDETSFELPLRNPSPDQAMAVRALMPALLEDLDQAAAGSTPQSHAQ